MSSPRVAFQVIGANKYQEALQHPEKVFRDPRLQHSRVECSARDIPRFRTGGFAVVYKLTNRDTDTHKEEVLALRCFKHLAPDLADRYEKISEHLAHWAARSDFLVTTRYIAEGIRIDNGWKPVTTMAWIEGTFLDTFLDDASKQPHLMAWLESRIRRLSDELQRAGMAHGDLHHKNILISQAREPRFKLIDYDGMFVPALAKRVSNEFGQADFQHPGRTPEAFGANLDYFSLITLYLNVIAVQRHPELWDAKVRTDGLLTRFEDYIEPDTSQTLAQIGAYADLSHAVRAFRRICLGSFAEIPNPNEFFELAGDRPYMAAGVESPSRPSAPASSPLSAPPSTRAIRPVTAAIPTPTVHVIATDRRELRASAGDQVVVVGRYERYSKEDGTPGSPFRTLHVVTTEGATFEVMVEREVAHQFTSTGRRWTVDRNDWLCVSGVLLNDGDRFVIDLEQAADLSKLDPLDASLLLRRRLGQPPEGPRGGSVRRDHTKMPGPGDAAAVRDAVRGLLGMKKGRA